jgi:hypothetical protein
MRDDGQVARATRSVALEGLAAAALSMSPRGLSHLVSGLGRPYQKRLWDLLEDWPERVEMAWKALDLTLVGAEARAQLASSEEATELVASTDAFLAENAEVTREAADNRLLAHAELRLALERGVFAEAPLDTFVVAQLIHPSWPGLDAAAAATLAEQLRNLGYSALAAILDAPSLLAFRLLASVLAEQLWTAAPEPMLWSAFPDRQPLISELARPDSILDTYLRTANRPRSGRVRRNRPAPPLTSLATTPPPIDVEVLGDDDQPIEMFTLAMDASKVDPPVPRAPRKRAPPRLPPLAPPMATAQPKKRWLRDALHSLAVACLIVVTALFLVAMAMLVR